MNVLRTTSIVLPLLVLLFSCSSPDAPEAGSSQLYGVTVSDGASVMVSGISSRESSGGDMEVPIVMAEFVDRGDIQLNVGSVLFNADTLDKEFISEGHAVYGSWMKVPAPPTFDQTPVRFTVTGSNRYPYVVMEVPAPVGVAELTQPILFDTIERSRDYTIEWNVDQAADAASIWIHNDGFGPEGPWLTFDVSDNGSYTIPASELQKLSTGSWYITLTRTNWKRQIVDRNEVVCMVVTEGTREVVFR